MVSIRSGEHHMLFSIVLGVLGAMVVVMVAAWAFVLVTKNGGWTDVFWTWGTAATLAASALWRIGSEAVLPRQWLVAGFMVVWGLRLGLYLTPRVATHPEDARYAGFREQWGAHYARNMLFVTLPQAPATALLAFSVEIAAHDRTPHLGPRDAAAALLFLGAIVGEYLSDRQMKRFRSDRANRGKVMDRGLWAWSRHPNYFFQWLGWMAYPVMALHPKDPVTWLTLLAPAVMFGLLRFVSGVPPLEQAMLKTRGDLFRSYQARVSAFFPMPAKRAA
jgi:steroid 5-alpha reductase family enzyme